MADMADKIEPTCRDCLIDFLRWYTRNSTSRIKGSPGYSVDAYLRSKEAEG